MFDRVSSLFYIVYNTIVVRLCIFFGVGDWVFVGWAMTLST